MKKDDRYNLIEQKPIGLAGPIVVARRVCLGAEVAHKGKVLPAEPLFCVLYRGTRTHAKATQEGDFLSWFSLYLPTRGGQRGKINTH